MHILQITFFLHSALFTQLIHIVLLELCALQPRVLGHRLTQKDSAGSGVQFITPAGPRQSLLLAKDADQFL